MLSLFWLVILFQVYLHSAAENKPQTSGFHWCGTDIKYKQQEQFQFHILVFVGWFGFCLGFFGFGFGLGFFEVVWLHFLLDVCQVKLPQNQNAIKERIRS